MHVQEAERKQSHAVQVHHHVIITDPSKPSHLIPVLPLLLLLPDTTTRRRPQATTKVHTKEQGLGERKQCHDRCG